MTHAHKPFDDQWTRLRSAWPRLRPWQRKFLLLKAYWLLIPRLGKPVLFALRTALGMFTLFTILPIHPMSVPTAIGGGLAFALITH
jgi:hypothetical protein